MPLTDADTPHLRRAVALAREALEAGDEPFGTVLTTADGRVLAEDRNRIAGGDATRHPELALAQWAPQHLTPAERATAICYTSGEHCPMCSAAHGWVGLGRIVYVASSAMLAEWLQDWGIPGPAPVNCRPIQEITPLVPVDGPAEPDLVSEIKELHHAYYARRGLIS